MSELGVLDVPWVRRALDPRTPTTEANETIRSASADHNGTEILFPTIRMINGSLQTIPIDKAFQLSVSLGDFINAGTPENATRMSKGISDAVGRVRNRNSSMISSIGRSIAHPVSTEVK
tara:strand:+ start:403 stop:759 length:357 start_codon:yes stop_codon:yes gene_type:complete